MPASAEGCASRVDEGNLVEPVWPLTPLGLSMSSCPGTVELALPGPFPEKGAISLPGEVFDLEPEAKTTAPGGRDKNATRQVTDMAHDTSSCSPESKNVEALVAGSDDPDSSKGYWRVIEMLTQ